jgi:hypothetical protein
MDVFLSNLEAVDCGGEVVVKAVRLRPSGLIPPLSHPRFDLTAAQQERLDDNSTKPGSKRPLPRSRCSEELVENVSATAGPSYRQVNLL